MFDFTNDGERDRSPQGLFTAAYLGVMMQGRGSVGPTGACAYLGTDGSRCAVGWLEDDEKTLNRWDAAMTGGSVCILIRTMEAPRWMLDNVELLTDMQEAHDSWMADMGEDPDDPGFIPHFQKEMAKVARQHGLTVPAIAPVGA